MWLELYDIAEKIQKLEPWNYLWDRDLLMYEAKDGTIYYCSVLGKLGVHRAINIHNEKDIPKFLELEKNGIPEYLLINYQECLSCEFLSKEDTLEENIKIIKELDLNFKDTWISFERFEKGYESGCFGIEQVKLMIELLNNFYIIIKEIVDNKLKINFDKGDTIFRKYDKKEKKYINSKEKINLRPIPYKALNLDDETKKRLRSIEMNNFEYDYEFLNYLPVRIDGHKFEDGRYYLPRIFCISNNTAKMIVANELIDMKNYKSEEDYTYYATDKLINFITENGRPKTIYVRDLESFTCISFLKDIGIDIKIKTKFELIDKLYTTFMNHRPF